MSDLVEINKRLNPFKPMINEDMLRQSTARISEAGASPTGAVGYTPKKPMGRPAKVAVGAGGTVGTLAAIGGGIYAARKVAQKRAAAAIEQRAARVAAAKEAEVVEQAQRSKKTLAIGGGALAAGVAAPVGYAAYQKKQGG